MYCVLCTIYYNMHISGAFVSVHIIIFIYIIYIVVPPPPPPPSTRGGCRPPPPPMMCCIYARTHTLRTSPSGLLLATRSLRALSLGTAALASPSKTLCARYSQTPSENGAAQYCCERAAKDRDSF